MQSCFPNASTTSQLIKVAEIFNLMTLFNILSALNPSHYPNTVVSMFVYIIMVNFCGKHGKTERKTALRFISIHMKPCKILLTVSNRDVFSEKILYKHGLYFHSWDLVYNFQVEKKNLFYIPKKLLNQYKKPELPLTFPLWLIKKSLLKTTLCSYNVQCS